MAITPREMSVIEGRVDEVVAESEKLGGILGNKKDLVLLQRALTWALGHYGSANAAIEAHRMHQAFFELSHSDVKAGYDLVAQPRFKFVAERIEPTWVVCYSCGCSFECHKPAEEISDTELCGMDGCSGVPEDWIHNVDY